MLSVRPQTLQGPQMTKQKTMLSHKGLAWARRALFEYEAIAARRLNRRARMWGDKTVAVVAVELDPNCLQRVDASAHTSSSAET